MRRRILVITAVVVLLPVVVLAVEVQLARTAPLLDDEDGFRPMGVRVRPGSDPLRVLWLGDSTSTGVGTDRVEQSMAWRVADGLGQAQDRGVVLTVLGVSGAQVHEVLDNQMPALSQRLEKRGGDAVPDHVFVSIGANDATALTRRPTFRGRYERMVRELTTLVPAAEITLVGIPDMGTAPRIPVPLRQLAGVRAAQLDDDIDHIAADIGLHHVDLAQRTSRTFSSDPDRYFSGDGFHPSPDGHELWADAVLASLDGR